jgi:hypothetical protein
LTNEGAGLRLNPCETVNGDPKECEVGPDNLTITQLSDTVFAQFDDSVTLQVHGVPVLVNPESELLTNEVAGARIDPCLDL